MELNDLQRVWQRLGRDDPLWAVLSDARYKGGGWDPVEFFAAGVADVERVFDEAAEHGLSCGRGTALDFGCGVGRLSQALAAQFESVVGVDIADSMVEEARLRNLQPDRCRFLVNDRPDLSFLADGTFDFVLSLLVLQHMETRYASTYIREFVRVLKPGGLSVFQIPAERHGQSQPRQEALPDGAYRAELSADRPAFTAAPGAVVRLDVQARNVGQHSWPPSTNGLGVGIGNHWCRPDGSVALNDDARAYLSAELAPGAEARMELAVTAPAAPGRYVLELDMVHEGVTWFGERGSATVKIPVRVRPPRWKWRDVGTVAVEPPPVMEMNMMPMSEVTALVESAGGQVQWADPQQTAGYDDCTYFVTKS